MHPIFVAIVLLFLLGGREILCAGEDDLQFAEMSERRLEKNPQDEAAWTRLVEARLQDGDFERAEKALAAWKAKVVKPSASIDRMRGEVAFAKNLMPEAIDAWTRYLKADPKDWQTRVQLSTAYARQREWAQGVRELSKVIETNAEAEIFAQRALHRIRLHDWAAAEADIKEANRLDATGPTVKRLFPSFERSSEWLPAVKKLDAAIAKDRENVSLLLDRAEWLMGVGLHDAGLDDVQAALKTNPISLRARVWRGAVAWERGNPAEAGDVMEMHFATFSKDFRTGLRTIDANPDPEARARFLLLNSQPLLALEQVVKTDGSPAKAGALLALDRLPEAGIAARRATEVNPGDSEAWLALGRTELQNGNLREGLDALNRSTAIKRTKEAEELRADATQRLDKK